eukprot:TRINITY_DN658_c0_g1_i1.p1 TRINITY_DN658_c0_g1~~TRINITY_DN658_c0_g1_i1.p1  ORF type:complete len:416 (+),score=83.59 TRINITY_DN658_c0_g1_i1:102-1349(+)
MRASSFFARTALIRKPNSLFPRSILSRPLATNQDKTIQAREALEKHTTLPTSDKAFFERLISDLENRSELPKETSSKITRKLKSIVGSNEPPIRVAVTGASGQIGYSLVFRIASGQMFGNRPVILQLIELPQALQSLKGVVMELKDCAFPLVKDIVATDDLAQGFDSTDVAVLVGARPRSKGMERGDLILANAEIFSKQGAALNQYASKDVKTVVVGNPANTNALICQTNAPRVPPQNFSALTRLDHNRGLSQIAEKAKCAVIDIHKFAIWGNHSATQFPDISNTLIKDTPARQILNDLKWEREVFIPAVQQRGAEIIAARGLSSAASAASAAVDHVRDWFLGTDNVWTSMAVVSKGEYNTKPGLVYSFPVTIDANGQWKIVEGLHHDEYALQKLEATQKELLSERDTVAHLLKK